MSSTKSKSELADLDLILNYVDNSQGLKAKRSDQARVEVHQEIDSKIFTFNTKDISEVIHRFDSDGRAFIQINFNTVNKVLLTDTLVGFKPQDTLGLDMSRIPKVVTTPDLQSVFEAIEEALSADGIEHEVEILKKVYLAILCGGEKVGFDLRFERLWLNRLLASKLRACA